MSIDKSGGHNIWPMIQTLVLVATAASIFLAIGRRDQEVETHSSQIHELREITQELVKSQVLGQANDNSHVRLLDDLKRRIERLENLDD